MTGYKTAVFNFIKVFGALLVAMGAMSPETIQFVQDNIEAIIAAYLALEGAASGVLRHFTTTEPFWRRKV